MTKAEDLRMYVAQHKEAIHAENVAHAQRWCDTELSKRLVAQAKNGYTHYHTPMPNLDPTALLQCIRSAGYTAEISQNRYTRILKISWEKEE